MNTTNYAGIDYGHGQANKNTETGIRFGVISIHSVNPDAVEDIYAHGENLSHKQFIEEQKLKIERSLTDALEDFSIDEDKIKQLAETVFDDIEQDINDRYEENNDTYLYKKDGYIIQTSELGLIILESPYFTYTQFCSPCVPGAGNLDAPLDTPHKNNKTYCLGTEWFEDKKPYEPYLVKESK